VGKQAAIVFKIQDGKRYRRGVSNSGTRLEKLCLSGEYEKQQNGGA
jgi:hypothetical protein